MNRMTLLCVTALALSLLGAGCVSPRQFVDIPDLDKKVEDPGKGRIYVFRPAAMGTAVSMEVWDGDVHVARREREHDLTLGEDQRGVLHLPASSNGLGSSEERVGGDRVR